MVEVYRGVDPGALKWIGTGKIRKWGAMDDESGKEFFRFSGPDWNDLLLARIIAYYAGSSQAEKTDYADDMMKAVMRENHGSSATGARNITSLGFTVAADKGLAPSITKAFSRKVVLDVLMDIAKVSQENGTPLYFDLRPELISASQIGFIFETYVNQIGTDLTAGSSSPVYFGKEWGNLNNPSLWYDYSSEANYAYSGGQGQGVDRLVVEASDASRIAQSPWNRREAWVDARDTASAAVMQARAEQELGTKRPVLRFSGTLLDTPSSRYGVDWEFGDLVTAEYRGKQFDGMVRAVKFKWGEDGTETVEAKLEVVEAI
jgi:hypothetical protein